MIGFIRTLISAVLILSGTAVMIIATIGVNRFHYVLNRMHAAALGDTLGIGLFLLGLMVHNGLTFVSLKLLLLISNLEVQTNPDLEKECEIVHHE